MKCNGMIRVSKSFVRYLVQRPKFIALHKLCLVEGGRSWHPFINLLKSMESKMNFLLLWEWFSFWPYIHMYTVYGSSPLSWGCSCLKCLDQLIPKPGNKTAAPPSFDQVKSWRCSCLKLTHIHVLIVLFVMHKHIAIWKVVNKKR